MILWKHGLNALVGAAAGGQSLPRSRPLGAGLGRSGPEPRGARTVPPEVPGEGGRTLGLTFAQMRELLGENTLDVYLNGSVFWKNVPARVWHYTIGGYQVVKKWLSYRESNLLGRPLRKEEVREVTDIARRIAAILLMEPDSDANYHASRDHPYSCPHPR